MQAYWFGMYRLNRCPMRWNTIDVYKRQLLAREEGVALGANVNDDILLSGAGLNDIAAGTADRGLLVLGMDALFHVVSPLSTVSRIKPLTVVKL